MVPGEGGGVAQRVLGGVVAVAQVVRRTEARHEPPAEILRVHAAQFRHGLEQEQGGVAIVSLVAGSLARVIVVGGGRLEAVDAIRVEAPQLLQVVDPMNAQAEGVADELPPDRPAHAVGQGEGAFGVGHGSGGKVCAHPDTLPGKLSESSYAGRKTKCTRNNAAST